MGGVVKKVFKSVSKIVGGGSTPKVTVPKVPDYEAERKKAEDEAQKKRSSLASQGMGGTILGGSLGNSTDVKSKKLLGE